jgi:hypothetical protein
MFPLTGSRNEPMIGNMTECGLPYEHEGHGYRKTFGGIVHDCRGQLKRGDVCAS